MLLMPMTTALLQLTRNPRSLLRTTDYEMRYGPSICQSDSYSAMDQFSRFPRPPMVEISRRQGRMGSKVFTGILYTFALWVFAVYSAIAQSSNWPAARLHHTGAYDDAHKEFVVYGGYTWNQASQKVQAASDVWAWNGISWRLISDTGVHKYVASMAYDSKLQLILTFGGADDSNAIDGKLSSLEAGSWKVIKDLPSLGRADATLVYDFKRDRLVLFGGRHENVLFADTWEFDGNDWKPTFMAGPSLRSAAAAVYDSARGVTVLYGGFRPPPGVGGTLGLKWQQGKRCSESGARARSWPRPA